MLRVLLLLDTYFMGLLQQEFHTATDGLGELLIDVADIESLCQLLNSSRQSLSPQQVAHSLVDIVALATCADQLIVDLARNMQGRDSLPPAAVSFDNDDVQKMRRLSVLVASRFLLNRLAPASRLWLVEDEYIGPVLEIWQFLTQRPLPGRLALPLTDAGWQQFLGMFGGDHDAHAGAGPWIAVDQPSVYLVEEGAAWQFPVLPAGKSRVWWLSNSRTSCSIQQLRRSLKMHDSAIDGAAIAMARSESSSTVLPVRPASTIKLDIAGISVCAVALLSMEMKQLDYHQPITDLTEVAADMLLPWLDGTLASASDISSGGIGTDHFDGLPDWSALPRRRIFNDMVTVTRPSTRWQMSGRDEPASDWQAAIDHYFADTAEVNPAIPAQVYNLAKELDFTVFAERFPELYHPLDSGQPQATLAGLSRCLASRAAINLLAIDGSDLHQLKNLLGSLQQQLGMLELSGDVPCWAGIPVLVTAADNAQQKPCMAAIPSEFGDSDNVMQRSVRSYWVPDTQTLLTAVRHCLGEFGVVHLIHVPAVIPDSVLTQTQASELVQQGAVCLQGNCASPIQLVACGAKALSKARRVAEDLQQAGAAFSLVYLAEPSMLPGAGSANESVVSGYLPATVAHRLVISEVMPPDRYATQQGNAGRDTFLCALDKQGETNHYGQWLLEALSLCPGIEPSPLVPTDS